MADDSQPGARVGYSLDPEDEVLVCPECGSENIETSGFGVDLTLHCTDCAADTCICGHPWVEHRDRRFPNGTGCLMCACTEFYDQARNDKKPPG
jgi:hypothetical protein